MPPFSPGDQFTVTSDEAPFFGCEGVVEDIDENDPWPVIATVVSKGVNQPCSYRVKEITPKIVMIPVAEVPVMGT